MHGEDDAGFAVEAGVAALGAGSKVNVRYLAERDAVPGAVGNHQIAQIFDLGRAADVADQNFARLEVDKAAAGVGAELLQGVVDRLETYIETGHAARIGDDAVLAYLAPEGNDLGNAGDGQQLRAYGEVGQLAQRHRIDAGTGHGNEHDFAHHRRDRPHLRSYIWRKLLAHQLQTLGNLLARAVDVDRPIELDVDDRKPHAGDRANAGNARHAVHRRLDGECDEQLDLLGGETFGFGDQRHGWSIEVGEDVDGKLPQCHQAIERDCQGADEHEEAMR